MSEGMPQTQQLPVTPTGAMLRTLGLIATLAGFLVVLTYQITRPLIEENQRQAIERALYQVLPGAVARRDFMLNEDGIQAVDTATAAVGILLYAGYDTDGRLVGVALEAAAQGLGIAIMHDDHLKRAHDNRLAQVFDIEVESPYSYWFVCKPTALEERPVRLFHDWLVGAGL